MVVESPVIRIDQEVLKYEVGEEVIVSELCVKEVARPLFEDFLD